MTEQKAEHTNKARGWASQPRRPTGAHGSAPALALLSAAALSSCTPGHRPAPGGRGAAFATEAASQAAADSASFNWFSYRGRDQRFEAALEPGHYRNPVIAGFHPDPSIVRVGSDYYLVNSSFAYFPGLPVFHSKDLVHWRQIGNALSRRSQLTFETGQTISQGLFAPTLRFHDGLFYIINTDVAGIGNFIITASDPAGPWSVPVPLPQIGGIDPDLFFDDDGRVYVVHNDAPEGRPRYEGHRAIWMHELDLDKHRVVEGSSRVVVNGGVDLSKNPIWIEGPHLYKKDGWYYLLCAEGGTGAQHSEVIFRARDIHGEFAPYEANPILTQRDLDSDRVFPVGNTGHADFVETPEGDWWAVFLGVRPYSVDHFNTGRETFLLPVRWESGWPIVLPPKTPIGVQHPAPRLPVHSAGIAPQTGNFEWRDDFDSDELAIQWLMARTSPERWLQLGQGTGSARLTPLPVSLSDLAQPAYLGRRQQHSSFTAETQMHVPSKKGFSAGLAVFQTAKGHYFLGVTRSAASHELFLERGTPGGTETVKRGSVELDAPAVVLGVRQKDNQLDFFYRTPTGQEVVWVEGADAKPLSTTVAGGFVGATVGIHARLETAR